MTRIHSSSPKCDSIAEFEEVSSTTECAKDDEPVACRLKPNEFVALTVLNLSNSKLTEFPESAFSHVVCLVELDLSNNTLEHIPDSLANARGLNKLNLSNNHLSVFPSCIANGLHVLQELNISHNFISNVPELACILVLRNLNCTYNMLTCFPKWLFVLDYYDLNELDLSENCVFKETLPALAYFPVGFRRNIRRLSMRNVGLTDSNIFILACFSGLEELDIGQDEKTNTSLTEVVNQVTRLDVLAQLTPELKVLKARHLSTKTFDFARLKHIEWLDLGHNWLMDFNAPVASAPFLVELRLALCEIMELPSNIGDLKALKVLDLSRNLITILPPSFVCLTNLEYLDLYYNYIWQAPIVDCFSNLKALDVCGNDFVAPPYPLGESGPSYVELRDNLRSDVLKSRLKGRRIIPELDSDDSREFSDSDFERYEEGVSPAINVSSNSEVNELEEDEGFWNVVCENEDNIVDDFDPRDCVIIRSISPSLLLENPKIIEERCPTNVRASPNFHVPFSCVYVPRTLFPVSNYYFGDRKFAEGQFEDV